MYATLENRASSRLTVVRAAQPVNDLAAVVLPCEAVLEHGCPEQRARQRLRSA